MNITTLWKLYMEMRLITTIIETIVAFRILGNNDSVSMRQHGHGGVDVASANAAVVIVATATAATNNTFILVVAFLIRHDNDNFCTTTYIIIIIITAVVIKRSGKKVILLEMVIVLMSFFCANIFGFFCGCQGTVTGVGFAEPVVATF